MSVALTLAAALPVRAETAAAITYETAGPMTPLPADLAVRPGVELRFLAITTLDGFRVGAALWQPTSKAAAATSLVVSVHGSGGNYASNPIGFLSAGLAAKGYGVLAINTRQHDDKVNTENFFDIRRDIEAAVATARALGYRRVALHGHSLGNIQVQFYAATTWDADLKAVVLTGMFANLPWKTRNLLVQNEANFTRLAEAAGTALREGRADAVLAERMRWLGGAEVPVSGQHFLTYRSTESSSADGTYWIRRVPRPILMVRDAGDGIIQAFEPHMLLAAATAPGSLVPAIKFVLLPNERPPGPAGHGFADNRQALIDTIAGWLAEQSL
ncbi:MAG: alpha/beta fold hydrolase [Proteobacteria bacterium]|nr:alpha/beta fold hydrolase [Pseudomonadota bacterium]